MAWISMLQPVFMEHFVIWLSVSTQQKLYLEADLTKFLHFIECEGLLLCLREPTTDLQPSQINLSHINFLWFMKIHFIPKDLLIHVLWLKICKHYFSFQSLLHALPLSLHVLSNIVTHHLCQVPRLRMGRIIPLLLHTTSWHSQGNPTL